MKKIFTGLTILFISIALHSQYSGGKGTASDPYLISSEADLDIISENPSSHYILTGDIHLSETRQPLPYFQGYLDGQGYAIHNLVIESGSVASGLFGVLLGGKIENLRLVNGSVKGGDFTGALAGSNEAAIISNCSVEGFTVRGNREVGGIAGSNFGIIENSYTADSEITGSHSVGGLTGSNYGGEIKNCYSTATVRGNYAGGLAGQHLIHGTISNSYAAGKVEGDIEDYIDNNVEANNISGGLIAYNLLGKVKSSFWDIEASGQEESDGGTGLTTVKMMQQASYPQGDTEWDFDEQNGDWAIEEWHTEPFSTYPYLQWQTEEPDPVGIEHNRPANYDDYFGEDGRGFYVNQNRYFWVSFPWISRDEDGEDPHRQTSTEAIRPLDGRVVFYEHWNVIDFEGNAFMQHMEWIDDEWEGDLYDFCSIRGYKVYFHENPLIVPPGLYKLPLYGTLIDPLTEIPVYEVEEGPNENWVGVFLPLITLPEALGPYAEGFFETIQTRHGTMVWENNEWNQEITVEYGDMVKLTLLDGIGSLDIQWHAPNAQGRSYTPPKPTSRPVAKHFPISYGPSFESLFIEDICFDDDIVEIGVYAGDECVGASVFEGEYPTEVLAYTNENHVNDDLSVVLYLDNGTYIRYDNFLTRELGSTEYAPQTITPLQEKFSFIKISRTRGGSELAVEDDGEEDEVAEPVLGLSQNYPNPFSLRSGVRGHGQTSISFAIPDNMPVELSIYNIRGQLVKSLISGEVNRGDHTAVWNGRDSNNKKVGSGIYFYRLETAKETITRKMLIVR